MQPKPIASRVRDLNPSPTLAITARAATMRASGLDVISFAAGEPDFRTPLPIIEAAHEAMLAGFTKYTSGSGIMELREVVADKFRRENGIETSADRVVITCGAKHALVNAILTLVEPGDEVIIIAPYWMSYSEQVMLAGGIPVLVQCTPESGFVPDPQEVAAAVTPKTKAMMICSPNNPTGAVWPKQVIQEIAQIASTNGIWLISDEVYEKLIYEGVHYSPAGLDPEFADCTITIGSCSKTFAMTGWRIGYMTGPKHVMTKIACTQDTISHPTSFAQKAAIKAFEMGDSFIQEVLPEFRTRRDLMHSLVNQIPGVSASLPQGAFYVMANVSNLLSGKCSTVDELAEILLQEAHVALIPGSVFSAKGFLRLSYATNREQIERGIGRMNEALQRLTV